MQLIAVPFRPNKSEYLALANRNILADQMEFLTKGFSNNMRRLWLAVFHLYTNVRWKNIQISEWKKQLLEHADSVFGRSQEDKRYSDGRIKDMEAKIGQQALEIDFLSKVLGR
jgi:hypothetical protein